MTTYVYRDGKLVEKSLARRIDRFHVSRLEPYESPIDGREVTSWGQRDRELRANDAYDPRDMGSDHNYSRGREAQYRERK